MTGQHLCRLEGAVPERVVHAVEAELEMNGIATVDRWDCFRRMAVVVSFVHQYSREFGRNPAELPDPRIARASLSVWMYQRMSAVTPRFGQYALRLLRRLRRWVR